MKKVRSIHFVGIKGVGLTPLAIIAKQAGISVTGSDVSEEFITSKTLEECGITIYNGFSPDHVSPTIDLVITTGAHDGLQNVEVLEAIKQRIPVMTKGQAVGEFMKGEIVGRSFSGIAIAGSHGKTTTTAMLTMLLQSNGLDPTYTVGTGSLGDGIPPGHLGKGKYFVAESDEYATDPQTDHKPQFMWLKPEIIVLTNIEHDHPDLYPTIEDVEMAFSNFSTNITPNGFIIGNGDDARVAKILARHIGKGISFGFSEKNDYVLHRIHTSGSQTFFHVRSKGTELGEFRLSVAGQHNAMNALAAAIVGLEVGLSLEKVKKGLSEFKGSKRRLEFKGQLITGAYVFDDYAHHPTEIKATLRALRDSYPKHSLVAIFQPHTYSRTKAFIEDFVTCFDEAESVMLVDIFSSAREQKDDTVNSELLAKKISLRHPSSIFVPDMNLLPSILSHQRLRDNVVVVVMGAGNIYKIIDNLPLVS
ncbi:MAG: UDP-N-acetylmuramate--L-alanine ligase [Candidatus Levybacteria bacterium]|nr:UDP-N-acetylmuramate--L-alanine ligase [Candidatus Levybacteria bacterium]